MASKNITPTDMLPQLRVAKKTIGLLQWVIQLGYYNWVIVKVVFAPALGTGWPGPGHRQ
jgi:hypothetical protein